MAKSAGQEIYESYPLPGVVLCNVFDAIVALLGAYILWPYGLAVPIIYLVYVAYQEFLILKEGCIHCYYYGKLCFCGKGICAAKLLKKGDPRRFTEKQFTWKSLLPTFMITLLPMAFGAILLAIQFDWLRLGAIVSVGILGFPGQGVIHRWACKHCKQREIGCPACELFSSKKPKKK